MAALLEEDQLQCSVCASLQGRLRLQSLSTDRIGLSQHPQPTSHLHQPSPDSTITIGSPVPLVIQQIRAYHPHYPHKMATPHAPLPRSPTSSNSREVNKVCLALHRSVGLTSTSLLSHRGSCLTSLVYLCIIPLPPLATTQSSDSW